MKRLILTCALAWPLATMAQSATGIREEVSIVFVGDVMVAETPGQLIASGVDPFLPFQSILQSHDIRIGNLECVVATGGKAETKPYTFRADPAVLPVLLRHFDAMSLANNHSGDFGKAAFAEQLGLMKQAGLPYFGGALMRPKRMRRGSWNATACASPCSAIWNTSRVRSKPMPTVPAWHGAAKTTG